MKIPVLLALPKQEPLVESALAYREKRAPRFGLENAKVPKGLRIDRGFAAVPVGAAGESSMLTELRTEDSRDFVVRAEIEVTSMEDMPQAVDGVAVFADPLIAPFQQPPGCAGGPVGDVAAVQRALGTAILQQKNLDGDGVAIAIVDTGINLAHLRAKLGNGVRLDSANSWTPPGAMNAPGTWRVDHGTMCAFDALAVAPKATLLDFPILTVRAPGGSDMSGSLAVAYQAYAQLIASWGIAFAPGGASKYKGLVVSNSWGMYHPSWDFPPGHPGRYCDNPQHLFNLMVGSLVRAGADVVFAAGNCGAECPSPYCQSRTTGTIMGCNAHADVLTVAGCATNGQRVGYSSQGPGIAGMAQQKPDLTAYTHFLGSEAYGAGSADTGTSTACPVAAGCIAALRTRLPHATTPPSALNAQLRSQAAAGAGKAAGAWNPDYGFGIIDPVATANSFGL